MTEKETKLELISLKERIEINRIRNVNSIDTASIIYDGYLKSL
jgi:hypothetical protein